MFDTEPTGSIKVLRTPALKALAGAVPSGLRGTLVGLTLPCYPYIGYLCGERHWILIGSEIEGRTRGVIVPQMSAIMALSERNLMATVWWLNHGFPQQKRNFFLAEDEFCILDGVAEAPMHLDIEIS